VSFVIAVAESTEPAGEVRVGLGAIVLTVAFAGLLAWVGYLVLNARRRSTPQIETTPSNLQPGLSDDELENTRLTRVLGAAVISAAVLAITLPLYWANESNRQEAAAEAFVEQDIHEGEKWWNNFSCIDCHGPEAGGGGASFTEARSGVSVSWAAPSLDDLFFRYNLEELTNVIVRGRPGTPMPANGLEGGGAMTVQEVDQVIAFLGHLQVSQVEALGKVDGAVDLALSRIAQGDDTVAGLIAEQEAEIEDFEAAPETFALIETYPEDIARLLSSNGTCTDESAALVSLPCDVAGQDTDRDGLTDDAERELTRVAGSLYANVLGRNNLLELVRKPAYDITFVTDNAFTNSSPTGAPLPDLDEAATFISTLDADHLTLSVRTSRQDAFLSGANARLEYLEKAAAERLWEIDFNAVTEAMNQQSRADAAAASAASGGSVDATTYTSLDAQRAVGLFNAYCARCHTAGYSAGVAFEQGHGSGAWGPSLMDGRSQVQFPLSADQIAFIIRGSNQAENYGVNGLGSGRMPSFGQVLTQDDIDLIVAYERTL
jgi:mono/diheme cytochrome c family protein